MYKYFSGPGMVFSNTSQASSARRSVFKYYSGAGEVFLYIYLFDTSTAPGKPEKYLKTLFRRRRSINTHFSSAGEVLIYTYLAPEKPEKPRRSIYIHPLMLHEKRSNANKERKTIIRGYYQKYTGDAIPN